MSLYNMINGYNPLADVLITILGLTPGDVGRFRDCYLERDPEETGPLRIVVYTRNGGGNREHFSDEKQAGEECDCTGCTIEYKLPQHPLYIKDRDDDFDCTYASVYFRIPERFVAPLTELVTEHPEAVPKSPAVRFDEFLTKLKSGAPDPDVDRVVGAMAPVLEKISEAVKA
jgi:hypothetical protein